MNQRHLQKKVVAGIVAVTVVIGLYVLNRHRAISPSLVVTSTEHPLAPDFSLSGLDGHTLNLSDYRGKVVLLDFWATWCEPCREETPHFVELQNKYQDQGFQIIGVSMDDGPEPVRDFYQQFKMNYPVVMGSAKTGELYGGVLGLPIAFLIGRDGRIYFKHIGAIDISSLDREINVQLQVQ
ncbi:MAG: redoxin domain-containing protein [Acidobacteriia bacterium]|nr:redoxin domain-containing protein [Terriglobia bacterium]